MTKKHVNLVNVPNAIPCTSNGATLPGKIRNHVDIVTKHLTKYSESEEEEAGPSPHKSLHLMIGEEILSNMIKNINNETKYLHYLKQLSNFEEHFKKKLDFSKNFRIVHPADVPTLKISQVKTSKQLPKYQPCKEEKYPRYSHISENTSFAEDEPQMDLIGRLQDRIEMRGHVLNGFEECCGDEESYESFVDVLLDYEESLTTG